MKSGLHLGIEQEINSLEFQLVFRDQGRWDGLGFISDYSHFSTVSVVVTKRRTCLSTDAQSAIPSAVLWVWSHSIRTYMLQSPQELGLLIQQESKFRIAADWGAGCCVDVCHNSKYSKRNYISI